MIEKIIKELDMEKKGKNFEEICLEINVALRWALFRIVFGKHLWFGSGLKY